ncbi:hypothetical protein CPB84DRAFT_1759840 [Gymnopilus junonius]|uniref:FAD/NAD(P)-binding domain-containing protein n=1 Tax=Gymnopilus junonius TaxID=109634 RepID=A0A9P5P3B8_GYMJU|nr:hypothetical protein CPB84DRAFT_1759840 [Gymnopilus junonius]
MPRTVKVAVIGAGLAGLTAARLLKQQCEGNKVKFEVHLFEKSPTIGMDSSSISLGNANLKQDWRIDVPMRSFQGGYYKNLIAFYRRLGVKFRQADFSYSFSSLSSPESRNRAVTTTMIYNGGSGRSGVSKPSVLGGGLTEKKGTAAYFLQKLRISALFICLTAQLVLCYIITLYYAIPFWRPADIPNMKFRDWTVRATPNSLFFRMLGMETAWREYVQMVLIPLLSAICTSPEEDVLEYPVEEILDYVWLTFGTHHYVVVDGVRNVITRLVEDIDHLHLASPITSLHTDSHDVGCITISCLYDGEVANFGGFQHIVLATQASSAVPLLTHYLKSLPPELQDLKGAVERQIQCLKTFEYRLSIVINHTDETLLPANSKDVRDLNLISMPIHCLCVSPSYTMATHILPTPKGYPPSQPTVFQTTNPIIPPHKDSLLSVAALERAVVTLQSKSALKFLCVEDKKAWWECPYESQTRLGELAGARNVVEQGILKREGVHWIRGPW